MSARSFVDSNVLVYALDRNEPEKAARATTLLAGAGSFVLSTQVLGEFYVTVTRKLRPPLSAAAGRAAVATLTGLPVVVTDLALVQAAIATAEAAHISYWDALIVEAAAVAGCDRVLTEDMAAGSVIRGVEIVDPFA